MSKIKGFGRCFARKCIKALLYVGKYPMEMIELLSAVFLLLFALYAMVPVEFLPQTHTMSTYPNDLVRMIFGAMMAAPSVSLLVQRCTSDSIDDYIYLKQRSRRKTLFWIAFTWFYIGALRAVAIAVFPPIFIAFLLISLITVVCYIRLGR